MIMMVKPLSDSSKAAIKDQKVICTQEVDTKSPYIGKF